MKLSQVQLSTHVMAQRFFSTWAVHHRRHNRCVVKGSEPGLPAEIVGVSGSPWLMVKQVPCLES